MPYFIEGWIDDCKLTATARTAKQAFAEAIDWHVAKQFSAVSIRDGSRTYSIPEFSELMALQQIADTRSYTDSRGTNYEPNTRDREQTRKS